MFDIVVKRTGLNENVCRHQVSDALRKGRVDVIINPAAIIGRVNPGMIFEALLGKVAHQTGKRYALPAFGQESFRDYVEHELKAHNIPDKEDLHNPVTGRKAPGVLTGHQYFMKLEHTSESKVSGRGEGGMDLNEQPTKGGDEGAKRLGGLQVMALLSHGATDVLRDAHIYRGTKNEDLWRRIRLGQPLPPPKVPFIYDKFLNSLKAAGINVKKDGHKVNIMAMTDKDVDLLAKNEVQNSETLHPKTGEPVKGGLMDFSLHGGPTGTGWSHIKLDHPTPNPVMEEPIRRLLGLTQNKFREVLAGREQHGGLRGPDAFVQALKGMNLDQMEDDARETIRSGRRSKRDDAVKQLHFITGLKKSGLSPTDMLISKVPVLPPTYRPVSAVGVHPNTLIWTENGMVKASVLYRDTMPIRLWSFDFASRSLVLAPVLDRFRHTGQKMGRIQMVPPCARLASSVGIFRPTTLKITPNSKVAATVSGEHVRADEIQKVFIARESLNGDQKQVLYGSALGDGHLSPTGNLVLGHCIEQEEYLRLKGSAFSTLLPPNPHYCPPTETCPKGSFRFATRTHAEFHEFRKVVYHGSRRTVSASWLNEVGRLGLAIWFMDDGTFGHDRRTPVAKISTQRYTRAEIELLRTWLLDRFSLCTRTERWNAHYQERDAGWVITFRATNALRLRDLVAPWVPECLKYKAGGIHTPVGSFSSQFNLQVEECSAHWQEDLHDSGEPSRMTTVYAFELLESNCYFADGVLVSAPVA